MTNPIRREPALLAGLVTALLGVLLVYKVLDERQAAAWGALAMASLPLVQGLVTRWLVIPTETVRQAGIDPDTIKRNAADPTIPRCDQ